MDLCTSSSMLREKTKDAIRTSVGRGQSFDIASQIDKNKEKIEASIAKTMELFE